MGKPGHYAIHIDYKTESFRQKAILCVFRDGKGVVYCGLSILGKRANANFYQQQLTDLNHPLLGKRPEYQERQYKTIFLQDNSLSLTAKPVSDSLKGRKPKVIE